MSRPRTLALLALTTIVAATSAACGDDPPSAPGRAAGFDTALRIPPLAEPEAGPDGVKRFTLRLQKDVRSALLPGTTTPTWGVNGAYLGPTVRAARGDKVRMAVTNEVGETTTLHWHGLRLPARMDGGPHQMIEPGATWRPQWTVDQPATTAWYHPHPHGATAMHVYRGLAGLFLVDDPAGTRLPHDYGVDDVPLIVQDKKFRRDGTLAEGGVDSGTFGFLGDRILVNGTAGARFTVTTQAVRLRLLNASNSRVYRMGLADERPFDVVGTDGGLLERPARTSRVKLSPGERAEIVVRFRPGERIALTSVGENSQTANDIEEEDFDLLQFAAAGTLRPAPATPHALGGTPPPPPGERIRTFRFTGSEINDKDMDLARIDEVVPAGAREIWEIDNTTYAHNFHIHEVAFRILTVNGAPPPEYQRGPKDTVFVPKKAKVRLAVEFGRHADASAPYMYHCHILRHEDKGMMGQFVVVEPGSEGRVPRSLPTGHHHD